MHPLRSSLFALLLLAVFGMSESAEADTAVFSIHTEKPVYDMDEEIKILINYTGDGEKYDVAFGVADGIGNEFYGQNIQDLNTSLTRSISINGIQAYSYDLNSYKVYLNIQNDCTQIICSYNYNFIVGIIQDKTNSSRLVGDENWTSVIDSPDIIGGDAFQTYWENNSDTLVNITTGGIEIWSSESYLTFWAKYNMSSDSELSLTAEGTRQYGNDFSFPLTSYYGFNIVYANNLTVAGDTLRGTTEGEWILFRVFLDSDKLGYDSLQRGIYENKVKFVFTIKGVEGEAAIGGIKVVNVKDYGFALEAINFDEVGHPGGFPVYAGMVNRADYVVRNIGTKTNTLSLEPDFIAGGNNYGDWSGLYDCMCAYIKAFYNDGTEFSHYPSSEFHSPLGIDGGLFSFTIPAGVNLTISIFLELPEIGKENALELDLAHTVNYFVIPFELNPSAPFLSEFEISRLEPGGDGAQFYLPSAQFIATEISFDKDLINEGDELNITVKFENEGYQESNVLVILCLVDPNGSAIEYVRDEQHHFHRVICPIDWGIVPIAESKTALEFYERNNWNEVKLSWDVYFGNVSDYSEPINVEFIAIVNPWYGSNLNFGISGEYDGAEPALEFFNDWGDNWIMGNVSVMLNNDDDGDFVIDTMDLCPELYGLGQAPGVDLGCPDTDEDGIHDEIDNCVNLTNADQKDDDNDNIGNVCDDYDGTDIDEDGVPGEIDNCIKIANSDQKDKDNDGFGDKCEPPPTILEIGLGLSFYSIIISVSIGTFLGAKHLVKGTFSDASKFVKGSFTIGCGIAVLILVGILINASSVDDSNSEPNYEPNPSDGSWNNDSSSSSLPPRGGNVELELRNRDAGYSELSYVVYFDDKEGPSGTLAYNEDIWYTLCGNCEGSHTIEVYWGDGDDCQADIEVVGSSDEIWQCTNNYG